MKKVLIATLAIIYLTVSSGVSMTIHYCMGKVSSVELLTHTEKCGKCGMKTNSGCCKDEVKVFKIDDSHKLITNDIKIFTPVSIVNNSTIFFEPIFLNTPITSDFKNHSPPISQGISLCILNSVFRI